MNIKQEKKIKTKWKPDNQRDTVPWFSTVDVPECNDPEQIYKLSARPFCF